MCMMAWLMIRLLSDYLFGFAPSRQPVMARPAYRRELTAASTFPLAGSMAEAGVVGLIAELAFDVRPFAFATIVAAPAFAHVTSGLWAKLLQGKRKAIMVARIQFAILVLIALVAVLPTTPAGGAALVAIVVAVRCLMAGMVTVRSVIWRANFAQATRAQVTGKLIVTSSLLFAAAPLLAALLFDARPWLFRVVYPVSAAIAMVSVLMFLGLRVRREPSHLAEESAAPSALPDAGDPADPTFPLRASAFEILKRDHLFRRYMFWQFIAGVANMAGNAAMLKLIAQTVKALPDDEPKYLIGMALTTSIPLIMMTLTVPFWAILMDRVHITRFRKRHGTLWIVTQCMCLLVAFVPIVGLFIVPRVLQGMVFGGGALAWQLGHHDFADRRLAATYMGIHQTLTGIRGAFAPYLGVLLLAGWQSGKLIGFDLPGFVGIGPWVFAVTAVLALIAWLGFVFLDAHVHRDEKP